MDELPVYNSSGYNHNEARFCYQDSNVNFLRCSYHSNDGYTEHDLGGDGSFCSNLQTLTWSRSSQLLGAARTCLTYHVVNDESSGMKGSEPV